ncbi:hypothetical protein TNCV_4747441 [Trichonephila clavipes]|nr:hypothetical protein TNCV_4747441 [Trichonephila clavipes]
MKKKIEPPRNKWIFFCKVTAIGRNTLCSTSFERKNATVAEVGVTLVKEFTNHLNPSILVQELFLSQTCPTNETCDNQSEPSLKNKVDAAETGSFGSYQLRLEIEPHHARVWDLTYRLVLAV